MRVKKGQLRRWNWKAAEFDGLTFITISMRVERNHRRNDFGWSGRDRGEILWTILEDGNLVEHVSQMEIHTYSEVIG